MSRIEDRTVAVLTDILRQHTVDICQDSRRLEGLLRDRCDDSPKRIRALIYAAQAGVPKEICSRSFFSTQAKRARLVQKLADEHWLAPDAAIWAVQSWESAVLAFQRLGPATGNEYVSRDPPIGKKTASINRTEAETPGPIPDERSVWRVPLFRYSRVGLCLGVAIGVVIVGIVAVASSPNRALSVATMVFPLTAGTGAVAGLIAGVLESVLSRFE